MTDDLISRQAAINAIENTDCELSTDAWDELTDAIMSLPPAHAWNKFSSDDERRVMDDLISRKWLMECVDEGWIKFDTEKDTNTYIHLVGDIAPPAQHEITEDEVKEWLHKRYLVVMDAALYGEMKSRCAGCVYEPIEGVRSIVEHGCAIIQGCGTDKRDHPECG